MPSHAITGDLGSIAATLLCMAVALMALAPLSRIGNRSIAQWIDGQTLGRLHQISIAWWVLAATVACMLFSAASPALDDHRPIAAVLAALLIGMAGNGLGPDGGAVALTVVWFAIRALLRLAIYILIGAMILLAVLSWINPYSPLAAPAYQLTRPVLDPIRRIMPTISGIDLSPLVAILLLQMVLMFL